MNARRVVRREKLQAPLLLLLLLAPIWVLPSEGTSDATVPSAHAPPSATNSSCTRSNRMWWWLLLLKQHRLRLWLLRLLVLLWFLVLLLLLLLRLLLLLLLLLLPLVLSLLLLLLQLPSFDSLRVQGICNVYNTTALPGSQWNHSRHILRLQLRELG